MEINFGENILTSSLNSSNGTLTVSTGDAVSGTAFKPEVLWFQQVGFASLPSLPTPGAGAAEAVIIDRDTCPTAIGSRDLRNQSFYGNLGPGETVLYAAGPQGTSQGRIILKADGSISIYTTNDNTSGGTAVYFRISPQGLQFISPDCVMSCDKTGFHVKTSQGAKLNLTNIGSIPGLPVSPTSAFSVQAGTVTLDSSMISLGPSAANGGLGYMNAVYGLLPAVPLVPIIGEGIGVVAVNASTSTKVCIGI